MASGLWVNAETVPSAEADSISPILIPGTHESVTKLGRPSGTYISSSAFPALKRRAIVIRTPVLLPVSFPPL